MNIFNTVTVHSLKKNKIRTLVTIIGIMLSTALICAVTTSFASVREYAIGYMEYSNGKWHANVVNADYSTYETISDSDEVKDKAVFSYIGYAEIGSKNDYKPYLYISGFKEETDGLIPLRITSGRMPQNSSEILLPDHLKDNGEVDYKVGDTIDLEIGDRKIDIKKYKEIFKEDDDYGRNTDSYILVQNNPLIADDDDNGNAVSAEFIDIKEKRQYTVVGIYQRGFFEDFSAPGYTALTTPDAYTEDMTYDIYYRVNNTRNIYNFIKENNLPRLTNTYLLLLKGISRFNSFYSFIISIFLIVVGLIMFGSIMLIYNAFAISVSERTKQFGLLSSIGATKKQLRQMVRFEATVLSIIGIPLGILLGIAGMWITFLAIGNKFNVLTDSSYTQPMRICISPAALVGAAVIAFITIRISAWIPSKRATRVSAVDAIRQSTDIKLTKHIRTPKLIYKMFGLPGMLAHKYFKRSKKKYRTTIVSLFMSIILFVSASAFTNYLTSATNDTFNTAGYDYKFYWDNNYSHSADDVLKIINDTEHITEASYLCPIYQCVFIPEDDINPKVLNGYSYLFGDEDSVYPVHEGYRSVGLDLLFVNDDSYLDLIRSQGLPEEKYYNKESPVGVAVDEALFWNEETERTERLNIFKRKTEDITLISYAFNEKSGYSYAMLDEDAVIYYNDWNNDEENKTVGIEEGMHEIELRVGTVIDESPYFTGDFDNGIIYPYSFKSGIIGDFDEYNTYKFCMNSDDISNGYKALVSAFKENKLEWKSIINYAQNSEDDRNIALIVKVFAYGFIVLISLISAANVFNTITTNINLRRREFAMLKSVGMGSKGIKRMLNFECVLYGTKALLYGIPVSAGVTYLIYRAVNNGVEIPFNMPWKAVGISVLSVFLVVFVTMMYSMNKIRKDNTIDALKNENL